MGRRTLLLAPVALSAFLGGFYLAEKDEKALPSFHDMVVNHVDGYVGLVDPGHPDIRGLAGKLGTPEVAYAFVRDRVRFNPALPAMHPSEALARGEASCIGKSILLCSIYRAMGIPAADVRVVTGELDVGGALVEHAWVDLEYDGMCLQQDATDLLGRFTFSQFQGRGYTAAFVRKERFCFNDAGLAIVSPRNHPRLAAHP